MTGDTDFSGGYHRERAQFAASCRPARRAEERHEQAHPRPLGGTGTFRLPLVGTGGAGGTLQQPAGDHRRAGGRSQPCCPPSQKAPPTPSWRSATAAETGSWGKYGGYVGLTLEMFERDETHKLRQYPNKLASAALRRISALVGGHLHRQQRCRSGHDGHLQRLRCHPPRQPGHHRAERPQPGKLPEKPSTTSPWSSPAEVPLPNWRWTPRYLLVPRDLRLTGMQILYPSFAHESNIFSENMQKGQMGDVITVPEFSDANDWAAVADPRLAPGIILGERFGVLPEIIIADGETNGALFTNDEIRMKVRHWVSVFVADYRPLYKANVA